MTKPTATLKECIVLVKRGEEGEGWRRKREGRGERGGDTVNENEEFYKAIMEGYKQQR